MKTITILVFICLSHFSLFGQSIDSLILGNWNWNKKGENTVILKRSNRLKYNSPFLTVNDNDTMYCSAYGPICNVGSKRRKYSLRRGTWHFDLNGLLVLKHDYYEYFIEEQFEIIDSKENKITLKRVQHTKIEIN